MQVPCSNNNIISFLGLKIKGAVNQPRYGRVYNLKSSQILGCHNNWIIIIVFDDGTDEEDYKHINLTILDGNMMNMSLIIVEGNYSDIDDDDYTCHGYYIIIFSSYPFTIQADLSVDDQVIYSGEMVCKGTYFSNQYQFSLLGLTKNPIT